MGAVIDPLGAAQNRSNETVYILADPGPVCKSKVRKPSLGSVTQTQVMCQLTEIKKEPVRGIRVLGRGFRPGARQSGGFGRPPIPLGRPCPLMPLYPLMPVVATLFTSAPCARRKTTSTGAMTNVLADMSRFHGVCPALLW